MPYAQFHGWAIPLPLLHKRTPQPSRPTSSPKALTRPAAGSLPLHAIAVMLFDSVAFRNVVSNGLVLDKNGNKMSKRLGNAVDPFETLKQYGPDATALVHDQQRRAWGESQVQRRRHRRSAAKVLRHPAQHLRVLRALREHRRLPLQRSGGAGRGTHRTGPLDPLRTAYAGPYGGCELRRIRTTRACRAIADFVSEHLGNWYVRLSRRRFWKGDYTTDKIAAYQTLYTCLETVAVLMSPVAPFYADRLFRDLNAVTGRHDVASVHLALFPQSDDKIIDKALEERMELAQQLSSMVLSLRKKVNIRVRQPLARIMIPAEDERFRATLESVRPLVLAEVNVKNIEYITDTAGVLVKKIRPNFKVLGKKVGGLMKDTAVAIGAMNQADILRMESEKSFELKVQGQTVTLSPEDVEILSEDIPGWQVASEGRLTVALDTTLNEELREEGIAREFINRVQNLRKDKGCK
ncbi:DUF5915 domain-containing protein [Candidatus Pollutiaquabacter sp.]|uniref:DUF5915 domain-containing protein n=1 Tax=Candidatus Pollutiaquabacter sp. TaxID=3416354 RepID=UPI003D0BAA3A